MVVGTYLLYDGSRGLVGGGRGQALHNAMRVVRVERWAHLGVERHVQSATQSVPGLETLFSIGYVTLHLGATVGVLFWLYRLPAEAGYARLRSSLVVASFISLVAFVLAPTAPPRLAGLGIADTVTRGTVNLNSSSLHWLYNPFAAFPSVHIAYALLVGMSIFRYSARPLVRVVGVVYPLWVAAEVIATGNHFILDVLAGACVGWAAWTVARRAGGSRAVPARTVDLPSLTKSVEHAAAA